MPESKTYSTQILIEGGISGALKSQLKELGAHFKRITTESKDVGKESRKAFLEMTHGVEGARLAVDTLKESLVELLAPILLVTGAFASVGGIFSILEKATDKFKEFKEGQASFAATLASTKWVQRHPGDLEHQEKMFEDQQERASKVNAGIFDSDIFEKAQNELVLRSGLGVKMTEALVAGIPLAVAKATGHLSDVTLESVKDMSDKVAKSLRSHRADKAFLFSKEELKRFHDGTDEVRQQMILGSFLFTGRKQYLDQEEKDRPGAIKMMQLQVENAQHQRALGKEWVGISGDVKRISLETQDVFLDILRQVIIPLEPAIKGALDSAETGIKNVGGYLTWLFKDPSQFGQKLQTSLTNAFKVLEKNETFKDLEDLWNETGVQNVNWIKVTQEALPVIKDLFTQVKNEIVEVVSEINEAIRIVTFWINEAKDLVNFLTPSSNPKLNAQANELGLRKAEDDRFNEQIRGVKARFGGGIGGAVIDVTGYNKALADAREEHAKNLAAIAKNNAEVLAATEKLHTLTNTTIDFDAAISKTTGNDLFHLQISIDQVTDSFLKLAGTMGIGGAGGTGGGGSGGGGNVFEQYPWEGHAANYGPHGNKLGEGYGVGLGVGEQAKTGAHFGDMVRIDFADGTSLIRRVNETSERNMGVEFFTGKAGSYNSHGAATVTKLGAGGIVRGATLALLGEKAGQSEAVVPLPRNGLAGSGHFSPSINFTMNVSGHGDDFVSEVSDVMRTNFEQIMVDSFREFERKRLS